MYNQFIQRLSASNHIFRPQIKQIFADTSAGLIDADWNHPSPTMKGDSVGRMENGAQSDVATEAQRHRDIRYQIFDLRFLK